ncbi:hypothetical protein [Streptomyces sp. ITFR-16]|uniref:hypothetical protein n=1 Tax=Streptomyces sp. ITFR-16 TaxID=3075198 RepID=UPI00288AF406|nr:hypothetical protein [Streptomyces sp. ITFR-16]WNI23249.1 hypothetical protein RLT58_15520 [Streptomyces sp. ITFR-16]
MNATPEILAVLDDLLTAAAPDARGALWQLDRQGRELDANLVRLPPGAEVGEHREDVLDVLLVVLAGGGRLVPADGGTPLDLTPTTAAWLPRTSRRALVAGPEGLAYVTVHRRRPGLTVKPAVPAREGGEAPCSLDRVCPACGRMSAEPAPKYCGECGERFPER